MSEPRASSARSGASAPVPLAEVEAWLAARAVAFARVEPLVGDVSSRSYFRVHPANGGATRVVARYPRELAAAQSRFRRAAALLAGAGVRVPRVLVDDQAAGFALVEDLGPETLYELGADWRALGAELDAALGAADAIARLDPDEVARLGSEPLGAALLGRELEQTIELFLRPRGLATPELVAALGELAGRLASPPLVPCHRDFMARNLIPDGAGGVGVLDFQDLRLGPAAYDLASLLNDSLFADADLEERKVAERLEAVGGIEAYRRAVAQRCLKAVGTFVKFAATGRTRHLKLVEPTLARALAQLRRLPESAAAVAPVDAALVEAGSAVAREGLLD